MASPLLPATFEAADLDALRRVGRPQRAGAREYVYHQEDPAQTVYLIETGLVKIARLTDEAREMVLDFLGPGDVFGAMDFADGPLTEEFAQAVERTDLRVIRRQEFEALLVSRPGLLLALTRLLGRRARLAGERLASLAAHDARTRLADLLDRLAARFGVVTERGRIIPRGLTHLDLANYIGAARETVTEALAEFARERRVERQGRAIIVTSRPRTAPAAVAAGR